MSADFDNAIDRAVREMLDVEPPAGLRQRVIARLPASGTRLPASGTRLPASGTRPARSVVASSFSWKILLPVAAAAMLVLTVLLARSTPRQPATTTASVPQPPTAPTLTAPRPTHAVEGPHATGASHSAPERRSIAAAVAPSADVTFDAPPAPGFPRLPALSIPELSVSSIQRVASVEGPGAIATDPIATPTPLAIEPLSAQGRQ